MFFVFIIFIYQVLISHYDQWWKYYLQTKRQADPRSVPEEDLYLSRKLFWNLFKALDKKVNHISAVIFFSVLNVTCPGEMVSQFFFFNFLDTNIIKKFKINY